MSSPFSVVSITSAVVDPFDLGTVVVHLPLDINSTTAQVSIPEGPADQIPHIIKGIVVHVRDIQVYVDRHDFIINPTSCQPTLIDGTVFGSGASLTSAADDQGAAVSSRFQAGDCAALPFEPGFAVATKARHTRRDGAYLHVEVSSSHGQANVHEVHVELPKALPSVLKTLQKACTQATFAQDPAACPPESIVGSAVVHTPVLPVPLTGPAYFVSHGGAQFPELAMVLQGYGVKIVLAGETFISKQGITSSTFSHVPDVPFESFDLTLPMGQHSALAGSGDFCAKQLVMPTLLVAQSGKRVELSSRIAVEGCPRALALRSHRVKKRTLILRLYVPGAGRLHVGGKGLRSQSSKPGGRKIVTVKVHEKHAGKLRSRVSVAFTPSSGKSRKRQVESLPVKFEAQSHAKRHRHARQ